MQATINRTGQSRQASMILALLIIGAVLVGSLVRWNARSGVRNDVAASLSQGTQAAAGAESEPWFPPQAQGYLPRAVSRPEMELTAADYPPQAHAYLPREMPHLRADLTAADFPPQAHGSLPQSIRDAGKAKAGCGTTASHRKPGRTSPASATVADDQRAPEPRTRYTVAVSSIDTATVLRLLALSRPIKLRADGSPACRSRRSSGM